MAPRYLAQTDLEARVGPRRVLQLFDDDNNGVLGAEELAKISGILEAAEGEVASRMIRAYSIDSITTLANADPVFKLHASWIALEFAAERRPEFLGAGGQGPYQNMYERAIKFFEKLSKGRQRSAGESEAGIGKTIGGKVQPKLPTGTSRFTFAPDGNNPTGHGGF